MHPLIPLLCFVMRGLAGECDKGRLENTHIKYHCHVIRHRRLATVGYMNGSVQSNSLCLKLYCVARSRPVRPVHVVTLSNQSIHGLLRSPGVSTRLNITLLSVLSNGSLVTWPRSSAACERLSHSLSVWSMSYTCW